MASIDDLARRLRGRPLAKSPRAHWRQRRVSPGPVSFAELRLALLFGIFIGLAWSLPDYQSLPYGPGTPTEGDVPAIGPVRVVDGDTFWAGGDKIRVADIDAPELRSRCEAEAILAARATSRLGELLDAGPFAMEAIGGRDEDRYGRKLRVVTRDGRSLGDQLVTEGLARTWTGRREPWC